MEYRANGTAFLIILQIAFIVLKLCKVISWSWLWVLAPTWIPIAVFVIVALIIVGVNHIKEWR